jgi:hypothetical protein
MRSAEALTPKVANFVLSALISACSLIVVGIPLRAQQAPLPEASQTQAPLPDAPQAQTQSRQSDPSPNGQEHKPSKNHIFWIIPNYREDEDPSNIKPLTPKAKFKIAFDDSLILQHSW